ncbi:MAG: sulfotransferase family 2 domain-containing protein [Pseudomonadota bacterium]
MKQYIRGYDLATCGLRPGTGLGVAQKCLRASRRLWSQHGAQPKADVATRKIISRNRRFLIAPIPKVGTKTLKVMLQTLDAEKKGGADIAFVHAPLHACLAELEPDYTVFSLVRNPWSRVLSCYRNKVLSSRLGDLAICSRYPDLSPVMSFPEFVRWLGSEHGRDDVADRHWISQTRLLSDPETGRLLCTKIGKFERFKADIEDFLEEVGLGHLDVLHINRTGVSDDPHSYRSAYDAECRDIIARRYRQDIETFGYSF